MSNLSDLCGFSGAGLAGAGPGGSRLTPDEDARRVSRAVLGVLFGQRRLPDGDPCGGRPCEACFATHLDTVARSILLRQPIRLILPGFPAKSPSLRKVLGTLPDMAERLSLANLQRNVCDAIAAVYPPGAFLQICSDGLVFADLVRVADEDVSAYARGIRALIHSLDAASLRHAGLDETLGLPGDGEALRRALMERHGEPTGLVRERVLADTDLMDHFNGIHRFIFDDMIAVSPGRSRNSVRNEAKQTAYEMLRRGAAWSALLRERFAGAVRLSVHPHAAHSPKLGVRLLEAAGPWGTPWHGVAVDVGGRFRLAKRSEAEDSGAELVYADGRPSHFVLEGSVSAPGRAVGPTAA